MNKQTDTTEKGLETHIAQYLVDENEYIQRENKNYDNVNCLDSELLFQFLEATQTKAVAKLKQYHKELYKQKIIKRFTDQVQAKGIIEVLRKGITDGFTDTKLQLFYDKPVSAYNTTANALYQANVFSVMRQVYFSPSNKKSLDLMVFINGIPVVSFELKNELTKQNVEHAIKQYKEDRDPNEELFRLGRLMVNFAVDTEEVWMCTHLKGQKSYFLPFNKGNNNGAGNPNNPDGIKTDYLWKEILTKNSITDILQNFCQLITEEKEYLDEKGITKTRKEKKLLFPRYHQLVAVQLLLKDAQENGSGKKYLIQHSAGSGKSNSISWLAHQLVGLHNKSGDSNVFDTVIVVTDRRVLDAQIRNNIKQFQQVNGVVEAITEGSKQLKQALEEGKKIIITTIQKFPFIVDEIGELPGINFAIIIDEAHSSVSGGMVRNLNKTLSLKFNIDGNENEEDEIVTEDNDTITGEDLIASITKSSKQLPNASYFAFTATPKNKTLELFGEPYQDGDKTKFCAFHLYSMKQAIDEGFIKDVLQNYTTYQSFYALLKRIEDDPEYDKKRAQKKLKAYVESHEHAVKKKAILMIQHFLENVVRTKKMGGLAKAMIVTSSRANAVKHKKAFDDYLNKINSPYKAIVAFSGEIDGQTEVQLNGFSSASIPSEFEKSDYRFLIVANKYQTGFDQPLLHTMYVDKKLGGVNAVQTLSRLNRSHPLKNDTFVLDFANTAEEIEKAFKPYFESTILGEATDPNKLFDLQDALDNFQVYTREQVEEFSDKIVANVPVDQLHSILDQSSKIFKDELEEEHQNDFRAKVKTYVRLYIFLSQIVPFENPYLERLYIFLNYLQNKLVGETQIDISKGILDNIDMDSYRLQLEATTNVVLEQGEDLKPIPTEMRGGIAETEIDRLSNILQTFNDRYGTEFTDVDKVRQMAESIANDVAKNNELINSIRFSDDQNARITSDKVVGDELLKHITTNFDLFKLYSDNKEFKEDFSAMMFGVVKDLIQKGFNNTSNFR
ncbi:type I restriction endonuclease subunit R [Flavobacterium psychrophilum]|uniref:type I restriction endonuclease subunit R n=1 Tax=Flavobacterium psychrophilum TaxID=96345 RepID=UPI000B7C15AE|nr:type I restriction endonuclease [Flavobacterium psychrophilum]EKT4502308.1 type I restriction endonuclease subunit R [Flavobacterium psychrophilum]MBF2024123.1 type I restriction endonuclease subunit R [Flavobacterium psychrophilum]MCB5984054.1 DEAD/DEAH box helicase family protein [Flavobacterium psychrophilum]MCB5995463.1 DEAD/DEAH box helicase family protein [Flavobacterium psychrophilum]MCB5997869.1 DEAD/DEAH box helicase family protein [Flavobacterium psychrophilum]